MAGLAYLQMAVGEYLSIITQFGLFVFWTFTTLRVESTESTESTLKSVFTEEYEQLLTRLIQARKGAALTQQELAQRLGRIQSFVSKYERGERRLDVIEFIHVAHAIGVNAADLVATIEKGLHARGVEGSN